MGFNKRHMYVVMYYKINRGRFSNLYFHRSSMEYYNTYSKANDVESVDCDSLRKFLGEEDTSMCNCIQCRLVEV